MNQGTSHIKYKTTENAMDTNMHMPDLGTAVLGLLFWY